jgi:hypothetical protein
MNMRTIISMLVFGGVLILAGCADTKWNFLRNRNDAPPAVAGQAPTAAQLVDYLNQNSQRIQSIQCTEMDLDCKADGQPFGLRAHMCCERPKSFRLNAEVLGKPAVDMGSNNQEFWYWISKAEPPYLVHCSYQDLAQGGVRMPFPFQPEWVLAALGMGEYGPAEQYQVRQRSAYLDLIQETVNSQNQRVRKVTVFNRSRSPVQVQAYLLQDANGKEICSAYIQEVQNVGGAMLPRRIKLIWPEARLQLTMKLEDVTINQPRALPELYVRPVLANVQTYDLKRGLDGATTQLRQAGGYNTR